MLTAIRGWVLAFTAVPISGLAASAHASPDGGTPTLSEPAAVTVDELVVTAKPSTTQPAGADAPEVVFGEDDILSQGAGTTEELLDALLPRVLSGAAGEQPLILLNGRPATNAAALAGIPPEALRRVEFLGPGADVKYGSRAGRQVINVVLRDQFTGLTTQVSGGAATEGGRVSIDARTNFLRIDEAGRWSVDLRYTHDSALLERERGVSTLALALPPGSSVADIQTLLPEDEEIAAAATYTKSLAGGVQVNLSGSVVASRSVDTVLAALGAGEEATVSAVRMGAATLLSDLNLTVDGRAGSWQWSLAASLDDRQTRTTTDYDILTPLAQGGSAAAPAAGKAFVDVMKPGLEALVSGPLIALPTGTAQASLKLDLDSMRLSESSTETGAAPAGVLSRQRLFLNASTDIPLAGARARVVRNLSANLNFAVEELSDFGSLTTLGAGLNWSPVRPLKLTASISRQEAAPSIEQLGDPLILRPNVRWFDQLTGQSVDVLRIEGGDPHLKSSVQRIVRAAATLRLTRSFGLSTSFTDLRTTNPVASVALLGTQAERFFPGHFTRAPDGRLLSVDVRPVNIAETRSRELNSGVDFETPLGRGSAGGPAGAGANRPRLTVSLHHIWRLENLQTLATGLPPIDYLGGEGGTFYPQHQVLLQVGLLSRGVGGRLNATWQDSARLRYAPAGGLAAGTLTYGSLAKLNLEVFANLAEVLHVGDRASWAKGARVTLSVDNLFDTRPRVRDAHGETPTAYLPALLDPVGRSIKLTLRKQF